MATATLASTSSLITAAASSSSAVVSPYHYIPTRSICFLFVALFSISTAVHLVFAIRYRLWWMFPTILLAGSGEILGWIGRSWSTYDVTNRTAFSIQILACILAPTPLLASMFIIFSNLSKKLGSAFSRLSPRWYSRIFLTCDIVALLIQAGGGAIAASANTPDGSKRGSDIMLIGIIFQTIAMVVFMLLVCEYYYRYATGRAFRPQETYSNLARQYPPGSPAMHLKLRLMSLGLGLATLFLFVRAIYRLFELADGWNGTIISTQWYFNLFDGGMVALSLYSLAFLHPGPLLFAVSVELASTDPKASYVTTTESLPMVPV